MRRIYLDYAASTPVDPKVIQSMRPYFDRAFGNPGSLHSFGQEAIAAVDRARETVADALRTDFRNIIFTGSATEANNLVLRGAVKAWRGGHPGVTPHLVVSNIEHESVLETARDLASEGVEITFLAVSKDGAFDRVALKDALTERTVLVSLMDGNNETGTRPDVAGAAALVREYRGKNAYPLVHADAAQTFGFLSVDPDTLGVDALTLSAHKLYGPKGVGALYINKKELIYPIVTGGGQEFGLRSSTENAALLAGFGKAVELVLAQREGDVKRIASLRYALWRGIRKLEPKARLNGPEKSGLPHILNVFFPGRQSEFLITALDLKGVAVSAGSACASRSSEPSPVLKALGYAENRAKSSIRLSLGRMTNSSEIAATLRIMKAILHP